MSVLLGAVGLLVHELLGSFVTLDDDFRIYRIRGRASFDIIPSGAR